MPYLDQIESLLAQQRRDWPLMARNFSVLALVRTRTFEFDDFVIRAQFNPARMTSTTAKVDPKSIAERKCFLCHLPPEQRVVNFGDDYKILCNPFPIFRDHLTIPHVNHTPQLFKETIPRFIDLLRAIGERYVVFYNGPRCGASAPDHLHFQAGERGFLPIETEYERIRETHGRLLRDGSVRYYSIERYLRSVISYESRDEAALNSSLKDFMQQSAAIMPADDEPMVNVLGWREADEYRVLVLPRARHRPGFYFAEEGQKLLLSPASVDLGGVCVLPREADFERLTKRHIMQMCEEVCLNGEAFAQLCATLKH